GPHQCPHCRVGLVRAEIARQPLEVCPSCAGMWIGVAVFDRICSDAEAQTAATGMAAPAPAPPDEHVVYLACPECGEPMSRINFAHRSGAITNVCRAHGVWLGAENLRRIMEFIRSGGMDRARAAEKEQLELARRRLAFERNLRDGDQLGRRQ